MEASGPGGNHWTKEALAERLTENGALRRVQRHGVMFHVRRGIRPYGDLDALAADVCATVKRHGERFESDAELQVWLDAAGVAWTPDDLASAIEMLERIGRIKRPRADQFRFDAPLPGQYVDPRIYNEN
jgi:hypothetical protein